MTTVNVYLNFSGNCEEAFTFYKNVFGKEFSYIGRYKDMPVQEGMPPLPTEMGDLIMHVGLPISTETALLGSDAGGEWAPNLVAGNNFAVSITCESQDEADRLFNGLSENGKVSMPMAETFWGDYFGMFTDKFGINWMVSFSTGKPTS